MKAIVLEKRQDRYLVEVYPDPACAGCSACSRSQGGKVLLVHSDEEVDAGTLVEIDIDDSKILGASFIAYGIPLIVFFPSLFLFHTLISKTFLASFAEWMAFIGSLGTLAFTYFVIHLTDAKRIRNARFDARIVKILENKEEPCHLSVMSTQKLLH